MTSCENVSDIIRKVFLRTHEGYSTDEVLICDRLNTEFIKACKEQLSSMSQEELNWRLLNLRKQGRLGALTSKHKRVNHDDYFHASEIAARLIYDKYSASVDQALCNPQYREEFDRIAKTIAPDVSRYLLRKAALKLRKNRQLKPELVPRVASSWGRQVLTFSANEVSQDPQVVPKKPGIYIFRDSSGYLYIGESADLYLRIKKHVDHSDRKSLAHYFWDRGLKNITVELHIFDSDSDGRLNKCRRAYEASLIQSRHPMFNIHLQA
jgi:hypothetical protein